MVLPQLDVPLLGMDVLSRLRFTQHGGTLRFACRAVTTAPSPETPPSPGGFIAIAIVVLGRRHPVGVALAALVFGAASALQYLFQAMGWALPYQLFLALPYVLTLVVLAIVGRRAS